MTPLPQTAAILYLDIGMLLRPLVGNGLQPGPFTEAVALESMAEAAFGVSLCAVGLCPSVPSSAASLAGGHASRSAIGCWPAAAGQ